MPEGKKVNYVLIPMTEEGPYAVLNKALEFHDDLPGCKIALAWRLRTKEDKDGKIVLGKCVKVTDLQKEFAAYDFIILLNREFWMQFSDKQKLALVDHELSHAGPQWNPETLEQIYDERGRKVWRTKRHDIEEFQGVVERHGLWKRDLERFAEAIRRGQKQGPLFADKSEDAADPMSVVDGASA